MQPSSLGVVLRLLRPTRLAVADGGSGLADATDALRAALDGTADALLPTSGDPAADALLAPLEPGTPLRPGEDDDTDPTALVLATSGSTGQPRGALLQRSALIASATATHQRLGGPGTWLLALPAHHVAGVQVLVRSLLAGTRPQVLDLAGGFSPNAFATATAALLARTTAARYTALVPTQLGRLLDAGGAPADALASYDGVLVGAAAAPPPLLERAAAAGVRVVTTYGMSETCGGCVYDGTPLPGVQAQVAGAGRVVLGGAVVARGYRLQPHPPQFTRRAGTRWFATSDLGVMRDGRLVVTGRADDVIVTGGLKVEPQGVEAVVAALPGVREVLVVGVPDPAWGQAVVAVLVAGPSGPPALQRVRDTVSAALGPAAAPRRLVVVDALPLRGPGKPDRAAAARLACRPPG